MHVRRRTSATRHSLFTPRIHVSGAHGTFARLHGSWIRIGYRPRQGEQLVAARAAHLVGGPGVDTEEAQRGGNGRILRVGHDVVDQFAQSHRVRPALLQLARP